eukprot:TRINITY_DN49995_c0_g1_i1.p1 TRINITY_DN49995_c0_g1~~TRINITY_DN49995_c0_g1_i1.p1  ORF type:complete len:313 (-),score=52.00 TRINITY_DN49995_c0_g1_i1:8-946(-)
MGGAASRVLEGLWVGGADSLDDERLFDQKSGAGVTHVVSACPTPCRQEGVKVLQIPVRDDDAANITQYFDPVIRFVHSARIASGIVYVHCSAGRSRSATLVVAYVMAVTRVDLDTALKFVITRRDTACPNPGFYQQLYTFEREGCAELSASLESLGVDRHARLAGQDAEEVAKAIHDEESARTDGHNGVDLSCFRNLLRQRACEMVEARNAGGMDGVPALETTEDGVVLWRDEVVARQDLDSCGRSDALVAKAGQRIRIVRRGDLNGVWEGECNKCRGWFFRSQVREMDCAESEDEDYYRGSTGLSGLASAN